jgi:hypothetical protein
MGREKDTGGMLIVGLIICAIALLYMWFSGQI